MSYTTTYKMNLDSAPYEAIRSGRKTVEMRLFDERRRGIRKGDNILFTNTESGEELLVAVEDVIVYPSFYELYGEHDKISIGYTEDECADPADMLKYYTEENIRKYGAIAIKIKLI